jgi:hypothetical protein
VYDPIDLMRWAPDLQHFFLEQVYPIGALHGECSLLSSMGMLLPAKTFELFDHGRNARFDKLFPLWREYMFVSQEILAPVEGTVLMDGAYDKLCARIAQPDMPLRLLSPYAGFDERTYQHCRDIAYTKFPGWLSAAEQKP